MNWKELPAKKTVKLLTLLLTSLLIASVSAAVYYSMTWEPTITVGTAMVTFTAGDDSTPAGFSAGTNNTYCALTGLEAYPNATVTYDQAVNLTNNVAETTDVQLSHVSITPPNGNNDVANFTSITFYLIDEGGSQQASFAYTTTTTTWNTPADTGYFSMSASVDWTIKVVTVAAAGAYSAVDCTIVIEVDVRD